MREKRRALPKLISPLESLDSRIVPSAVGMAFAERAALNAHIAAAVSTEGANHANALARSAAVRLTLARTEALRQAAPVAPMRTALVTRVAQPAAVAMPAVAVSATPPAASATAQASVAVTPSATANPDPAATTTTPVGNVKSGPMAKANQTLNAIYQSFEANGSVSTSLAATAHVSGSTVGIDVRGTGNVSALSAALANLGMTVSATDANSVTVEGSLPIANLPAVANLSQVTSLNPIFTPQSGPPIRLHS